MSGMTKYERKIFARGASAGRRNERDKTRKADVTGKAIGMGAAYFGTRALSGVQLPGPAARIPAGLGIGLAAVALSLVSKRPSAATMALGDAGFGLACGTLGKMSAD